MLKKYFNKILLNFFIVIFIFAFDRVSKLYVLNLAETDQFVNIYINQFLNFHLIWNTGIGFGLFSSGANFYYNFITLLIILINFIILIMIFKSNNYKLFLFLIILGGGVDFSELCITSGAKIEKMQNNELEGIMVKTNKAEGKKCPVCWKINTKPCERHFS